MLKKLFLKQKIFTGLPDFPKLVLSVFKITFTKSKPKEIVYRNYRKFNENNFNPDFQNQLSSEQTIKLLRIKKAATCKTIPPKVLKSSAHSCSETLTKLFNESMNNSEFPDELKLAEVKMTFKNNKIK